MRGTTSKFEHTETDSDSQKSPESEMTDFQDSKRLHFLCKVRTAVTHGMGKSSLGPDFWGQWYRVDKYNMCMCM